MKSFFSILFLVASNIAFSQFQTKILILDYEEKPLENIQVFYKGNYIFTDKNGETSVSSAVQRDSVIISYLGSDTEYHFIDFTKNTNQIILQNNTVLLEELTVRGFKVDKSDPFTFSEFDKEEISEKLTTQDIPMLLQKLPNVLAHSDAGNGMGYTYMRIRGSDQTRINVTVNGIPINDSESHGVFWVNMPDIASSASHIQVQRGVGTSTNGAGAFGASVNIKTSDIAEKPFARLSNFGGSFASRKYSLVLGTGLMKNNFAFEGRYSQLESDGYVDRAGVKLNSFYLSGTYATKNTVLKAIVFGGDEITNQSWYGVPEALLRNDRQGLANHYQNNLGSIYKTKQDSTNLFSSDRRFNYYTYDNQVDDYGQDHFQLHWSQNINENLRFTSALHWTIGGGYFEEYRTDDSFEDYGLSDFQLGQNVISESDFIRRRALGNDFYGGTLNIFYQKDKHDFQLGGAVNQYKGDHFGNIIWAENNAHFPQNYEYYFSDATKNDGNIYLKYTTQWNEKISTLIDLQYRNITYQTAGVDNDLVVFDHDLKWSFFNPKVGVNYLLSNNTSIYSSLARGNREPVRSDIIDNAELPKAEELLNFELGFRLDKQNWSLDGNVYLMNYKNQLVPTGELNDVGAAIRTNVDKSFRRGIEISSSYGINKNLFLSGNFSINENKITDFNDILYDYTNGFDVISTRLEDTDIALSPRFTGQMALQLVDWNNFSVDWSHNYVGKQFLDNTSNQDRMIDSYYTSNVALSWHSKPTSIFKNINIQLHLNNIWNTEYEAFGYTYSYRFGETITENFYYPQATFNWMLGVIVDF